MRRSFADRMERESRAGASHPEPKQSLGAPTFHSGQFIPRNFDGEIVSMTRRDLSARARNTHALPKTSSLGDLGRKDRGQKPLLRRLRPALSAAGLTTCFSPRLESDTVTNSQSPCVPASRSLLADAADAGTVADAISSDLSQYPWSVNAYVSSTPAATFTVTYVFQIFGSAKNIWTCTVRVRREDLHFRRQKGGQKIFCTVYPQRFSQQVMPDLEGQLLKLTENETLIKKLLSITEAVKIYVTEASEGEEVRAFSAES